MDKCGRITTPSKIDSKGVFRMKSAQGRDVHPTVGKGQDDPLFHSYYVNVKAGRPEHLSKRAPERIATYLTVSASSDR
jgi:hypothetical protein